ncbi:MAG: hypothetical protein HUU50_23265 [Candidatus Brocadiae bacterium]|nr:hypothetical protein [Candidatus Brocadiia bacterium]
MTTKERLYQEIEDMTEEQKENTLRYVSIIKNGIKIERFYKGRPVIKIEELEKIDCPYPKETEWENEWEDTPQNAI